MSGCDQSDEGEEGGGPVHGEQLQGAGRWGQLDAGSGHRGDQGGAAERARSDGGDDDDDDDDDAAEFAERLLLQQLFFGKQQKKRGGRKGGQHHGTSLVPGTGGGGGAWGAHAALDAAAPAHTTTVALASSQHSPLLRSPARPGSGGGVAGGGTEERSAAATAAASPLLLSPGAPAAVRTGAHERPGPVGGRPALLLLDIASLEMPGLQAGTLLALCVRASCCADQHTLLMPYGAAPTTPGLASHPSGGGGADGVPGAAAMDVPGEAVLGCAVLPALLQAGPLAAGNAAVVVVEVWAVPRALVAQALGEGGEVQEQEAQLQRLLQQQAQQPQDPEQQGVQTAVQAGLRAAVEGRGELLGLAQVPLAHHASGASAQGAYPVHDLLGGGGHVGRVAVAAWLGGARVRHTWAVTLCAAAGLASGEELQGAGLPAPVARYAKYYYPGGCARVGVVCMVLCVRQ